MRYHLTPVRIATIKKTKKNAPRDVEKGELSYGVGEDGNYYSHYGKPLRFLKELKIELSDDLAISLLGVYPLEPPL
jgi:hypothetical protein